MFCVYKTNFHLWKASSLFYTNYLIWVLSLRDVSSHAQRTTLLLVREGQTHDVTKPAHSNFKNSYRQNGRLFEIENWFCRLLTRATSYNISLQFSFKVTHFWHYFASKKRDTLLAVIRQLKFQCSDNDQSYSISIIKVVISWCASSNQQIIDRVHTWLILTLAKCETSHTFLLRFNGFGTL